MKKIKVVAVVGPTASGKTGLAVELAKRLNGEIVSADSMQIYKGMDIASAKPTVEERSEAVHHLVDFLEPSETFSVARYVSLAKEKIFDIHSRGKLPIICGGTGLYIDSLLSGTSFLNNTFDEEIRKKLFDRLETEGTGKMYEELQRIDPDAAEKIHKNNSVKIMRALEIYYTSGKTLSRQNELSHIEESPFDSIFIGLKTLDREVLYSRINKRVDMMLDMGLEEEARDYFKKDLGSTVCQAIGHKELKPYFDGMISREEAVENLKRATRRYAKRQLTWFRRNEKINWLNSDEFENTEDLYLQAVKIVKEW